jgi:transposase
VVAAREGYGVEVVGPLRADCSWQAKAGAGFDLAGFVLDFDRERAVCPEGKASSAWRERRGPGGSPRVHVEFSAGDCRPCRSRAACVRGKATHRNLTVRTRVEHEVLIANRAAQATREWKDRYKARAGVEGTMSQAVNGFGMRTARYVGLAKTGLQATVTAVGINVRRVDAWLAGTPHARTRVSRLATLGQAMAA